MSERPAVVNSHRVMLTTHKSLERVVREATAAEDHAKVKKIIDQLCHEFAYAVHAPHARNGGLIGLAAASIALGPVRNGVVVFTPNIWLTMRLGSCPLSRRNRPARISLLLRSRCSRQILCLRGHVQHCQGSQG